MWRLRELEKRGHWREFRDREQAPRGLLTRGRLLSDTLSSSPPHSSLHRSRRHERCEHSSPDDHDHREERYWTRRLLKQEESDPTRCDSLSLSLSLSLSPPSPSFPLSLSLPLSVFSTFSVSDGAIVVIRSCMLRNLPRVMKQRANQRQERNTRNTRMDIQP